MRAKRAEAREGGLEVGGNCESDAPFRAGGIHRHHEPAAGKEFRLVVPHGFPRRPAHARLKIEDEQARAGSPEKPVKNCGTAR
jgi:hypothetical protein